MSDSNDQERKAHARERAQEVRHLPISFSDNHGHSFQKSAPVCGVTEEEIRRYAHGGRTCGECGHFQRGHAQAEMARTNFVRELVKDYEWNPEHAGLTREKAEEVGLCDEAGNMATAVFNPACDHFVEDRGRLKKEATREERGVYMKDLRAAAEDHEERFKEFKRRHGLTDPEIVEEK